MTEKTYLVEVTETQRNILCAGLGGLLLEALKAGNKEKFMEVLAVGKAVKEDATEYDPNEKDDGDIDLDLAVELNDRERDLIAAALGVVASQVINRKFNDVVGLKPEFAELLAIANKFDGEG